MKIGFSSLVCPSWSLETIVAKAAEYGYDGVEIRGLCGELRLPQIPELVANPGATRQLFAAANVELVCLASSCTLAERKVSEVARKRVELEEYIELASKLGCPFVRMFAGEVGKGDVREATLGRVARELAKIASFAARKKVTVLVENGGDFPGSADLWYLCDNVAHPAISVCWNPCTAMTEIERPTISIPRLGTKIGMFHVCDGQFDRTGFMEGYKIPGTGNVELDRAIELLKGIAYREYLMFEWPKLWVSSLAAPEQVLPQVQHFLRRRIDEKQAVLSAYKGDKNPAKLKTPPSRSSARPI